MCRVIFTIVKSEVSKLGANASISSSSNNDGLNNFGGKPSKLDNGVNNLEGTATTQTIDRSKGAIPKHPQSKQTVEIKHPEQSDQSKKPVKVPNQDKLVTGSDKHENENDMDNIQYVCTPVIGDDLGLHNAFQGHATIVTCREEIRDFRSMLYSKCNIKSATHNILAYRFKDGNKIEENVDEDGEKNAGKGLINLMRSLDLCNVAVCVSRWYSAHMGPTRFDHINLCATDALIQLDIPKVIKSPPDTRPPGCTILKLPVAAKQH